MYILASEAELRVFTLTRKLTWQLVGYFSFCEVERWLEEADPVLLILVSSDVEWAKA